MGRSDLFILAVELKLAQQYKNKEKNWEERIYTEEIVFEGKRIYLFKRIVVLFLVC